MPGTPSSDIDLWPDSWRRHAEPRYRVNLAVVGVVLVLAPIGIAGSLFARDNVIAARYALAVAVLGALIVWIGVESRLRLRRASARLMAVTHDAERPGLQIPYSRRIHVLITALMGAFALVFIMAAVDSAGSGGVYFWSALAVVCASFPVLLLRRKYTLGYVLLTSDGVLHRGCAFRSFLPWAGIDMIHPLQTDGPDILITARDGTPWEHAQITRLWQADKPASIPSDDGHATKPAIHIPGKYLGVDPALVLATLVFYGQHPEARSELGSADGKRCSASHTRQQTSSKAKSSRKPSRMSA